MTESDSPRDGSHDQDFSHRNGGTSWLARRIGDGYEGPFSDLHEMHAFEWGLMVGMTLALLTVAPSLGAVVAAISGIKGVRDVRRDGVPPFVARNASYAVVSACLGYGVVHLVGTVV